ncbi:MAG: methionyl-tRNA formyltransferase, partial [Nitrosarchaeum sp.]|nr:methionyl-tRNA formyltransferase [Nitrosarchaeum sp.]
MKKVVGFLSRQHGYNVLQSLVKSREYELIKVYTHKLNPKSQDPNRSQRSDYDLFVKMCSDNNITLESIDSKDYTINNIPKCDFLVE